MIRLIERINGFFEAKSSRRFFQQWRWAGMLFAFLIAFLINARCGVIFCFGVQMGNVFRGRQFNWYDFAAHLFGVFISLAICNTALFIAKMIINYTGI